MVRGSGKFKTKRGGGRSFSKNLELNEDGVAVQRARKPIDEEDEDEDEEEEEEEKAEPPPGSDDDDDDDEEGGDKTALQEMTRTERRALKKQSKAKDAPAGDADADLINPNHVAAKNKKISDIGGGSGGTEPLSRREREEKEKKEAKERYWKLHEQGKTDQAKSDLARLAAIRKEREEAAAKRKAEAEAKKAELDAKLATQKKR